METKAFEKVRDQVGVCGIWCGSCVVGNEALQGLTKRYEELIRSYGLRGWAPQDFDYGEFEKGLASIGAMPPCPGCLKGGGRENCEIKACTTNKGVDECNACHELPACEHAEILQHMRTGAVAAGLFVKTGNVDSKKLIEKWRTKLESKWPSCILFRDE